MEILFWKTQNQALNSGVWNVIERDCRKWAKETSMREMMQRAQDLGANAIVGIDIDYETVGANGSMLMVATSGTAVVI